MIKTDSDHDMIFGTIKTKGNVINNEFTKTRCYKDFDKNCFKMDLIAEIWTEIYSICDPKVACNFINDKFTKILDLDTPRIFSELNYNIKGVCIVVQTIDRL